MAVRTISIRTRAALGTLAAAMEVAVAVKLKENRPVLTDRKNRHVTHLHNGGQFHGVHFNTVHLGDKD